MCIKAKRHHVNIPLLCLIAVTAISCLGKGYADNQEPTKKIDLQEPTKKTDSQESAKKTDSQESAKKTKWEAQQAYMAEHAILLWPNDPERNSPDTMGDWREKKGSLRLHDIVTPHLVPYLAEGADPSAPAVILVPGGGYSKLVVSGYWDTAKWLNDRGIHAFILLYRCPSNRKKFEALPDLQRGIRMVRHRAAEWNINPDQIGIFGGSAGGNLSVSAGTSFDTDSYEAVDEMDQASPKPNFTILRAPAWLAHRRDLVINSWVVIPEGENDLGPTIIFSNKDDKHHASSAVYGKVLNEAGKSVREHYWEKGGHGFGSDTDAAKEWMGLLEKWLQDIEVLKKNSG